MRERFATCRLVLNYSSGRVAPFDRGAPAKRRRAIPRLLQRKGLPRSAGRLRVLSSPGVLARPGGGAGGDEREHSKQQLQKTGGLAGVPPVEREASLASRAARTGRRGISNGACHREQTTAGAGVCGALGSGNKCGGDVGWVSERGTKKPGRLSARAFGSRVVARFYFTSAATRIETILSGFTTGSPRLISSTWSMPSITLPQTVYWRSRKVASSKQMKNWLLALLGF